MLGSCLTKINPEYHSVIKLAATLTVFVENFFSKMHIRNDMLTILEFVYLYYPTIHETLKQLHVTDTGFVYYTLSSSHYEFPEMMTLSFGELPSIPFQTSIKMAKEDKTILRDWRDNFGKLCIS